MKKLIAMFAAAAMAFGLYAEDETPEYASLVESILSFADEDVGSYDWRAADGDDNYLWFTEAEADAITASIVEDADENANVLSLSTGNALLYRTAANVDQDAAPRTMDPVLVQDPEGDVPRWGVTFQQRVKFTGFEEAQTNLADGAKFALWALETEEEGTVGEDDAPSTNLYVTCGEILSADDFQPSADPIVVKLNVPAGFDPYAWHTVKITMIQAAKFDAEKIPGFVIAIDGTVVGGICETGLFPEGTDFVSPAVEALADENKVFPSFVSYAYDTDLTVKGVGYQGIGSLASVDVIPDSTYEPLQTLPVTVAPIEGVNIVVEDSTGVLALTGDYYFVTPGDFTVTYTAAEGYVLKGEPIVKQYNTDDTEAVDDSATVVPQRKTGFAVIIASGSDTNYYPTLAAAITAATATDTVTLFANAELDACIDISKAVKLDIGNYSITPKADALDANKKFATGTTKDALFVLHYGADFTVNGGAGVIDTEGNLYAAIKLTEAGDQYVDTTAKLTVNANLTGTYYAITGSGNAGRGGTEIVINGGLIKGTAENDCAGIYHPQAGTLTINGGTIEGATGIYAKAGDCEVSVSSGATIKGVGTKADYRPYTDGFYPTGDAIVFDSCNYPGGAPNAKIKGGTFESTYAAAVAAYATAGEEPVTGIVTGGSFKGQVAPDPALAGGSMAFPTFVPGEAQELVPAVASVNDVNYKTAAEALAAVQALEATEDFPIVATALADAGLTIVNPDTGATITIAQNDTITIDENSWTFSGSPTITGQIALAAGAAFTVAGQIANYTTVFSAPTDYVVTETKNDNDTYTYSAAQSAAKVVEIVGGDQYATLGEAIAALTGGETIKLLANYTVGTTEAIQFSKSATLDLGGFTLSVPEANLGKETEKPAFAVLANAEVTLNNGVIALGFDLEYIDPAVTDEEKKHNNGCGYGIQVRGVVNANCTITRRGYASPIFDIYGGSDATVNVLSGADITSTADVFRHKKTSDKASVYVSGGTLKAPVTGSYCIFNGSSYRSAADVAVITGGTFLGKFEQTEKWGGMTLLGADAADARFDDTAIVTATARLATGYEFVDAGEGLWKVQAIPSFDVTFTKNATEALGSTNVLRDTALTADMIPAVEGGEWDVNPLNAVITCNTNFNYTVAVGPEWPEDDPDFPADADATVKEKFVDWATTYGVKDVAGKSDAFLMNVDPTGDVPELEIESIAVEGTTATITVGTDTDGFDLGKINGVLYVESTDELAGEWTIEEYDLPTGDVGETATFTVTAGKFMRAKVGFKAPVVE